MKKIGIILSSIVFIAIFIFFYFRIYVKNLSYDVDLVMKITELDLENDSIVMPLRIFIDNKNSKSITIKHLRIKMYDSSDTLIAESYNDKNSYEITPLTNNKFNHDFRMYINDSLIRVINNQIKGLKSDVYILVSFNLFFIPISIRQDLTI